MSELEHAKTLRAHWRIRQPVTVELTGGCAVRTITGLVESVSVIGQFAYIDGWHVPISKIDSISAATQVEL